MEATPRVGTGQNNRKTFGLENVKKSSLFYYDDKLPTVLFAIYLFQYIHVQCTARWTYFLWKVIQHYIKLCHRMLEFIPEPEFLNF